jgi:hypothetical protein
MSDSLISWNPRMDEPSKPDAVGQEVLLELARRDSEVLPGARQVGELQVDQRDPMVAGEAHDVVRARLPLQLRAQRERRGARPDVRIGGGHGRLPSVVTSRA